MYSKIKKREQEYVKTKFSIYGKHPINNYLCSNNFTDKACEEYNPGSSKHPCRMYDDTKKKNYRTIEDYKTSKQFLNKIK